MPPRSAELLISAAVLTVIVVILLEHSRRLMLRLQQRDRLLIHNAKLASLGQMASLIGHEINNPLTVILLSVYELQELAGADSAHRMELKEYLAVIANDVHSRH